MSLSATRLADGMSDTLDNVSERYEDAPAEAKADIQDMFTAQAQAIVEEINANLQIDGDGQVYSVLV